VVDAVGDLIIVSLTFFKPSNKLPLETVDKSRLFLPVSSYRGYLYLRLAKQFLRLSEYELSVLAISIDLLCTSISCYFSLLISPSLRFSSSMKEALHSETLSIASLMHFLEFMICSVYTFLQMSYCYNHWICAYLLSNSPFSLQLSTMS
jgi:hypothetical protein